MNPYWRKFLLQNFLVIQSWVQYNKAQLLQDRNPRVPGIIYKICPENEEIRKLDQARDLWKAVAEFTGHPIKEIYTGHDIPIETLSIDHFVPRSYISNDELWNLIPMRRSLNSSKNNRLPSWDEFFGPFARYQFYLYGLIFSEDSSRKSQILISKFERCRKNNINAIWALENLYIPGNSDAQFVNILSHNLKPIYESAQLQGYDTWKYGDGEHYDNGRFFSDYKQESIKSLLLNVREVMLIKIWKTEDVRLEKRNFFAWINVIAKKV